MAAQKLHKVYRFSAFALATLLLLPTHSYAESKLKYACPYLGDTSRQTLSAMTQGLDGWFFRENNLEDQALVETTTREYLGRLHQLFKEKGTELVMLSVPPRGLIAAGFVAKDQPMQTLFDKGIAIKEYDNFLKVIRETGLPVVDVMDVAPTAKEGDHRFFFPRDIHWTPMGSRLSAEKTAALIKTLPDYTADGLAQYTSRPESEGEISYRSKMAEEIQSLCTDAIAEQKYTQYITTKEAGNSADALFGDSSAPPLVLLGTSFSAEKAYNFEGFLSEYTGLDVANFAISAGGLFNSIISYTSLPEEKRLAPKFIVWEALPYYNYNDANAYRQLIPAIAGECSKEEAILSKDFHFDPQHTEFSITVPEALSIAGNDYFIFVSTPNLDLNKFTLELDQADGDGEWNSIDRSEHFDNTGRFFFELNDELSAPLKTITIGSLPELSGTLEVRLCRYPEAQKTLSSLTPSNP